MENSEENYDINTNNANQMDSLDNCKVNRIENFLEIQMQGKWPKGTTKNERKFYYAGIIEGLERFGAINEFEASHLYSLYVR